MSKHSKTLSFDGFGINDTDDFRSRIAKFSNDDMAKRYGKLFAAAPDMQSDLRAILNDCDRFLNEESDISPEDLIKAIQIACVDRLSTLSDV